MLLNVSYRQKIKIKNIIFEFAIRPRDFVWSCLFESNARIEVQRFKVSLKSVAFELRRYITGGFSGMIKVINVSYIFNFKNAKLLTKRQFAEMLEQENGFKTSTTSVLFISIRKKRRASS